LASKCGLFEAEVHINTNNDKAQSVKLSHFEDGVESSTELSSESKSFKSNWDEQPRGVAEFDKLFHNDRSKKQ
jgi:hypothetical protein